jgi:hypothetical protein
VQVMSDEKKTPHHHTIRERIDAAEAAADEVVADESGQLSGEVNALLLPFEEAAAALRAAVHPDSLAEEQEGHKAAPRPDKPAADDEDPAAG